MHSIRSVRSPGWFIKWFRHGNLEIKCLYEFSECLITANNIFLCWKCNICIPVRHTYNCSWSCYFLVVISFFKSENIIVYTPRRRLSAKCEGSAWPRSSRERVFLLSGKSWQFSKHEIYSKNKNHSSVCTHRFSESFYRVWFTGWFRTSYLFSLFRLNRLNLNYFWLVFCFYVSDSYFMLKMTCMIRFMTRQGLIGLQRGTH